MVMTYTIVAFGLALASTYLVAYPLMLRRWGRILALIAATIATFVKAAMLFDMMPSVVDVMLFTIGAGAVEFFILRFLLPLTADGDDRR